MEGVLTEDGSEAADGTRQMTTVSSGPSPETRPSERAPVHRLRDLDRSGKWVAAALAAALLLAPLLAFARYAPDWIPSGDPALMGLRALDVGTSSTPVMGQPSFSGVYVEDHLVRHLGPTHFYVMAPFVRAFGAPIGMLLVSLLIVGSSLLVAAWAVFRQLGPTAGTVAVVMLGAITFTTGAASLVNPVSSNIAGYPFLCSTVLLWCLLCGDLRLLPLTTGVVSFTAQQHLSVLPALTVATITCGAGLLLFLRRNPTARRHRARWSGLAAIVGLGLWLPVFFQQMLGNQPNLSELVTFSTHDDRPTLGFGTATRQVVHVLGLPPLLGQTNLDGQWLFAEVSAFTWATAGLVVAASLVAGWRWRRSDRHRFRFEDPAPEAESGSTSRRAALVVMAALLAVAGLLSGASVPEGIEQYRLVFYHWALALAFFVSLTLALAALGAADGLDLARRPWVRPLSVAVAILAVAVPNLVNPWLGRWSSSLLAAYAPMDRDALDELADEVTAHGDRLDGTVVLIARGATWESGAHEALALALNQRGVAVKHPRYDGLFVAESRLARRSRVDAGLVMVLDTDPGAGANAGTGTDSDAGSDTESDDVGEDGGDGGGGDGEDVASLGELIAEVDIPEGFDSEAYGTRAALLDPPRRVRIYLLNREELLDWATYRELSG